MNEHMLMVIDHQMNTGKYTQEELDKNSVDSVGTDLYINAAATATAAANDDTPVDFWVDRYFEDSSENKQDYIDEINRRNKQ